MPLYRLARFQCVQMGHPVTTGLPQIDFALTGELAEPEDAQAHYSETLIRLPLMTYFSPTALPTLQPTPAELGLPQGQTHYLCPMTLFKIHPDYDALVAGILRADPQGRFWFVQASNPHFSQR